jgi:hypothetical protein
METFAFGEVETFKLLGRQEFILIFKETVPERPG